MTEKRSTTVPLWKTTLVSLLVALIGGLVGAASAHFTIGRQSAQNLNDQVVEMRRDALVEYVSTQVAANNLRVSVLIDAMAVGNGTLPIEASILALEGRWNPDGSRLQASRFPEIARLYETGAALEVFYSRDVVECVERIQQNTTVQFWEISNLAKNGSVEWYADRDVDDVDVSIFFGVLTQLRAELYRTLVATASEEAGLKLNSGSTRSLLPCNEIPAYVSGSSTRCNQIDACFDLEPALLREIAAGETTVGDYLRSSR